MHRYMKPQRRLLPTSGKVPTSGSQTDRLPRCPATCQSRSTLYQKSQSANRCRDSSQSTCSAAWNLHRRKEHHLGCQHCRLIAMVLLCTSQRLEVPCLSRWLASWELAVSLQLQTPVQHWSRFVLPNWRVPFHQDNEVRDLTAFLLTEVCHGVSTEPHLQTLSS